MLRRQFPEKLLDKESKMSIFRDITRKDDIGSSIKEGVFTV